MNCSGSELVESVLLVCPVWRIDSCYPGWVNPSGCIPAECIIFHSIKILFTESVYRRVQPLSFILPNAVVIPRRCAASYNMISLAEEFGYSSFNSLSWNLRQCLSSMRGNPYWRLSLQLCQSWRERGLRSFTLLHLGWRFSHCLSCVGLFQILNDFTFAYFSLLLSNVLFLPSLSGTRFRRR